MMRLKKLKLINFRNYQELDLDVEQGLNVFVGSNGQGKTNLLEAIYFLSLLRSFKTAKIDQLKNIADKQKGFAIEGIFVDDNTQKQRHLKVIYQDKRKAFVDGIPIEKNIDFLNSFICVAFVPEDIEIITGSGQSRRQFLDILLSQQFPEYLHRLQYYNMALKNRNAILKLSREPNPNYLATYSDLMAQHADYIVSQRNRIINELNTILETLSAIFFHDGRIVTLKYLPTVRPAEQTTYIEEFNRQLTEKLPRDIENGFTSVGPHRDEMIVSLGHRQISIYGSAGEQRIAALILRLASLHVLYRDTEQHRSVILLLDDVFGELDQQRRKDFFSALSHNQIFLACTDIPDELKSQVHEYKVFNGHCIKMLKEQ